MEEVLRFWIRVALREEEGSVFEECVLSHLKKGMALGDLSGLDECYKVVYLFPHVLAAILRLYNLEVFKFLRLLGSSYLDTLSDLDLSLVEPTDNDLKQIAGACKSLTICKLNTCVGFGDEGFLALLSVLGDCEDLDLGGCWGLSSEAFGEIGLACPELKRLDLRDCLQIRPKDFKRLFTSLEEIRYLNVGQCPGVDDAALKTLGKKARGLENLNLRDCVHISSLGVESLDLLPLRKLELSGCIQVDDAALTGRRFVPELVLLNLSRCPLISNAIVVDLGQRALNLRALTLKRCSLVTDVSALGSAEIPLGAVDLSHNPQIQEKSVLSFLKGCKSLHSLSLKGCHQMSNTLCKHLSEHNRNIRYLNLSLCPKVDDEGVLGLSSLKELHCLYLHECGSIGDRSLRAVASRCTSLEELDVGHSNVTDGFLIDLAQHASSLKSLTLSHCRYISDNGVEEIVEQAVYLEKLSLAHCPHITVRTIQVLAKHLHYLKELHLGESCSLGVDGVRALIDAHFPLEELELPRLEGLDDKLLRELVEAYPSLKKLPLSLCRLITDAGIESVAKHCQCIVEIDLSGVSLVTGNVIEVLLSKCKSLVKVDLRGTGVAEIEVQEMIKRLYKNNPSLRILCTEKDKTIRVIPVGGFESA